MKTSHGMETLSHAPDRMVKFSDGAIAIGINRKSDGFYVAIMVMPDGRVAANSARTRKKALGANVAALGLTAEQVRFYHGNNAG